jgi:hypothetical protein
MMAFTMLLALFARLQRVMPSILMLMTSLLRHFRARMFQQLYVGWTSAASMLLYFIRRTRDRFCWQRRTQSEMCLTYSVGTIVA